ncbi:penicillin-binding protein 2 [Longimicrobium terrae]|uniref:Penicillin-binding protein 2 n=1 Tax=Longimicrobium terrae TaxID=1639882 RepID=A0A841H633_9BACT|nr:penicillin-binding protein 2 [Longimicrobium terrae]MBB4639158.1 penicillin-binding protein 2 [Longimicrobium terrae]MBB6073438.1 penicillin-binding protein 2 [Longimicrobium terrae]NNC32574.1 penicillin-binding protein 2 [Longimicrobium terrae]
MRLFQGDTRQRRTLGALFAVTFIITTLLTAFFQTQVVAGASYAERSEENRMRGIPIPAPRGTILDRHGDVVATSITSYSIAVLPGDSAVVHNTLNDLAPFLGLSAENVADLMVKRNRRQHDLLEVTDRATFSQAAAIEERRSAFTNLMVVERPQRYYPGGAAIGHISGYVTEITKGQLQQEQYANNGYRQGMLIGQAGIERQYELHLAGRDGARFVEVDAKGRVVDPRSTVGARAPIPGSPMRLTLDLKLQEYIHDIFPDTMEGAVVAMVPSTGEILAMYSHPSYDPNDFVGRIPTRLWGALNNDPRKPMFNRTITGQYPPASTFKTITAAMGLERGILKDVNSRMPISCTGGMAYAGRYSRCWYRAGHGNLNLAQAIENSCNVYFYQVGIRIGLAELARAGVRLGFASKTGIDLPAEVSGIFPRDLAWYKKQFRVDPVPSDVMSLAIGQGPNTQTPLRMAYVYSAIAGDGTSPSPHLVDGDSIAKGQPIDLGLERAGLEALWEGLRLVTEPEGTALQSSLARYKLYGKTGTAQNPQGADHGWFAGFAGRPGGHPDIAIAVIVEHGLHGDAAAPLGAKIVNYYLDRKYGQPFDPAPTLGERWRAGRSGTDGQWDTPNRRLIPFSPEELRRGRAAGNAPATRPRASDSPAARARAAD